jgi:hypothetical protein
LLRFQEESEEHPLEQVYVDGTDVKTGTNFEFRSINMPVVCAMTLQFYTSKVSNVFE